MVSAAPEFVLKSFIIHAARIFLSRRWNSIVLDEKKKKKKERKGNSSTWANYFLRNCASKRPDKSFDTNSEATTGKI